MAQRRCSHCTARLITSTVHFSKNLTCAYKFSYKVWWYSLNSGIDSPISSIAVEIYCMQTCHVWTVPFQWNLSPLMQSTVPGASCRLSNIFPNLAIWTYQMLAVYIVTLVTEVHDLQRWNVETYTLHVYRWCGFCSIRQFDGFWHKPTDGRKPKCGILNSQMWVTWSFQRRLVFFLQVKDTTNLAFFPLLVKSGTGSKDKKDGGAEKDKNYRTTHKVSQYKALIDYEVRGSRIIKNKRFQPYEE